MCTVSAVSGLRTDDSKFSGSGRGGSSGGGSGRRELKTFMQRAVPKSLRKAAVQIMGSERQALKIRLKKALYDDPSLSDFELGCWFVRNSRTCTTGVREKIRAEKGLAGWCFMMDDIQGPFGVTFKVGLLTDSIRQSLTFFQNKIAEDYIQVHFSDGTASMSAKAYLDPPGITSKVRSVKAMKDDAEVNGQEILNDMKGRKLSLKTGGEEYEYFKLGAVSKWVRQNINKVRHGSVIELIAQWLYLYPDLDDDTLYKKADGRENNEEAFALFAGFAEQIRPELDMWEQAVDQHIDDDDDESSQAMIPDQEILDELLKLGHASPWKYKRVHLFTTPFILNRFKNQIPSYFVYRDEDLINQVNVGLSLVKYFRNKIQAKRLKVREEEQKRQEQQRQEQRQQHKDTHQSSTASQTSGPKGDILHFYKFFDLPTTATTREIRAKLFRVHPDKFSGAEKDAAAKKIHIYTDIWQVFKDKKHREKYDSTTNVRVWKNYANTDETYKHDDGASTRIRRNLIDYNPFDKV